MEYRVIRERNEEVLAVFYDMEKAVKYVKWLNDSGEKAYIRDDCENEYHF